MARADTRRQMAALVRRWHASGETQQELARRHDVSGAKLRYLVRVQSRRAAVAFAPVHVREAEGLEVGEVEVTLATGDPVVVRVGTSSAMVRMVVSALRAAC